MELAFLKQLHEILYRPVVHDECKAMLAEASSVVVVGTAARAHRRAVFSYLRPKGFGAKKSICSLYTTSFELAATDGFFSFFVLLGYLFLICDSKVHFDL